MNQEKLENSTQINVIVEMRKYYLYILMIIGVIFFVYEIVVMLLGYRKVNFFIIFILICTIIFGIICILYEKNITSSKNINKNKIKEIGSKEQGFIIQVGIYYTYRPKTEHNYIIIIYKEKEIKISDLKDNNAFKILKLLLDPYPIEKNIKIPIDIYIYNNSIYAELDSVDLSKVNGYTEAKEIVNKEYKT